MRYQLFVQVKNSLVKKRKRNDDGISCAVTFYDEIASSVTERLRHCTLMSFMYEITYGVKYFDSSKLVKYY